LNTLNEDNNIEDDGSYTRVDNYALDHPDCHAPEIAVYVVLSSFCYRSKKTCNVSTGKIGEMLNCHRQTVVKAIDNLVAAGLVIREQRKRGCSFTYTLPHRVK
jgi:biotin operon repressor